MVLSLKLYKAYKHNDNIYCLFTLRRKITKKKRQTAQKLSHKSITITKYTAGLD